MLLIALGLLLGVHFSGALQPLDNMLAAWRANLLQRAPTGSIVVVEIDSQSVAAARQWPWPRARFARAIDNLNAAGANLVAFDVDFSARSDIENDSALSRAINADPGSIVLPTFLQDGGMEENAPLASLSQNALVASVNVPIDRDGSARRYARGYQHHQHYHQSMAGLLAGAPYGASAQFLIDYGIQLEQIDRLSFNDVFRGSFDAERIRGRNVIIGATALELGDEFATPVRPGLPGVYVHALAYESLVQGRALMSPSPWVALGFGLLVLIVLWPRRGRDEDKGWASRHLVVLAFLIGAPIAVQAFSPVSIDFGAALFAQLACFYGSRQRELARRAKELVRQREAHLTFVAMHDPETDLPNRRAMLERLFSALSAQGSGVVVAIAVGVDRFAMLRAAIGYANANTMITKLAQRLRECSGQAEVFHVSTSILGLVLTAPCDATARAMCDEGLKHLDTAIDIEGQDIDALVRIGSAVASPDSVCAVRLLEQATLALDHARMQSRRYVSYDPAAFPDPKVRLALTSDVAKGIARGEFSLVYQPKANARSREIVGAEALIRWRHPELGPISPNQFIQTAEETGVIDELTRWVLRQAISDQFALRSAGVDTPISVNISGRLLGDVEFCAAAIDAIVEAGASVCFEITETAIIGDPLAALSSIAAFRDAGIKISIDDYGAGLSSLSYLKQIAADELKLDKSLIGDIKSNARDRLILKSTIDLAHSLGMSVVSEGVEDEVTCAVLAGLGCDAVQGYLISKPVSADELARSTLPEAEAQRALNIA